MVMSTLLEQVGRRLVVILGPNPGRRVCGLSASEKGSVLHQHRVYSLGIRGPSKSGNIMRVCAVLSTHSAIIKQSVIIGDFFIL